MTYDHKDWEQILMSSAKDILTPNVTIASNRKLPWIELRTITELREGSLTIKLPEVQEASCSLAFVKFSVNNFFSESKYKSCFPSLLLSSKNNVMNFICP